MNAALRAAVERRVGEHSGVTASIASVRGVGGGCINDAQIVSMSDGRRYFVKSNPRPLPRMFEREAEGLQALGEAGVIRVPEAVGVGGEAEGTIPFIVMEYVPSGRPSPRFFECFGHAFAELHRSARAERFGFDHDNYLGSTPQPNAWSDSWVAFWRQHRLGYQLRLARQQGLSDGAMDRLGDRLLERLDALIAEPSEPPCLLHGDLWSGNFMADERGNVVLIDPATYYGRREADLAMTMLFGGFDARFYAAYEETWPLEPGSERRLALYKLYHLLNHLNLFGASYRGGCLAILRELT